MLLCYSKEMNYQLSSDLEVGLGSGKKCTGYKEVEKVGRRYGLRFQADRESAYTAIATY